MAALSGDEALLQAFADGQDVHAATARLALGKTQEVGESRRVGECHMNELCVSGS